ncbi:glycosyltransferase [Teredinibacter sp. KSP-S5-2]|uniref:glycosyltransferase n=1 Tax=Teredinibacter sp. KSP-S5-2 TaxID=3034506 RepID=UPI0029348556|nr:glycosyltransferase [Teredinibacter sp. KSP-S5-2]WNO08378.1 glycosyltransferase [Teredinibacter sp. KSP-S5-2]
MAKVLFVWEMGGKLGHILRLHTLASALNQLGHNVTIATPHKYALQHIQQQFTLPYKTQLLSQRDLKPKHFPRKPANFSELLLLSGVVDSANLALQISDTQNLCRTLFPDLVVCDAAPITQLITTQAGIATVNMGDGFFAPPPYSPLPAFPNQNQITLEVLSQSEHALTTQLNSSLYNAGYPEISGVSEIFSKSNNLLLTIEELDIYQHSRGNTDYFGRIPTPASPFCVDITWKPESKHKILAYLDGSQPNIENILEALNEMKADVHIYLYRGEHLTSHIAAYHALHIYHHPLQLEKEMANASLFISNGGHSTIVHAITQGVPCIAVPMHQEQFFTAQKLIDNYLGYGINPYDSVEKMQERLHQVISSEKIANQCQTMKKKYQGRDSLAETLDYLHGMI